MMQSVLGQCDENVCVSISASWLQMRKKALGIISRKSVILSVLSGMCALTTCSYILIKFE